MFSAFIKVLVSENMFAVGAGENVHRYHSLTYCIWGP